jgi:hypothetical protein
VRLDDPVAALAVVVDTPDLKHASGSDRLLDRCLHGVHLRDSDLAIGGLRRERRRVPVDGCAR